MRRALILASAALLVAPSVVAIADVEVDPLVLGNESVGPGETRVFAGAAVFLGSLDVLAGGAAAFAGTTVAFDPASSGITVHAGGTLVVAGATFLPTGASGAFRIVANPGATLVFTGSSLASSGGLHVHAEDSLVRGSQFTNNVVGVALYNVSTTIEDNVFADNEIGLYETGGFPLVQRNHFVGGAYGIKDWRTDPTIVNNTFEAMDYGVWHEQSESVISYNRFDDKAGPPTVGLAVIDTMSPVVEGNVFTKWGTAILIRNARAYVRNNTIVNNPGIGVLVDDNSAAMDVTGNLVQGNGGVGIRLLDATDVTVRGNRVSGNADPQIHVTGGSAVALLANTVVAGASTGVEIASSTNAIVEDNVVSASARSLRGIWMDATDGAVVRGNTVAGNFDSNGIRAWGTSQAFADNSVTLDGQFGICIAVGGATNSLSGDRATNCDDGFFLAQTGTATGLVADRARYTGIWAAYQSNWDFSESRATNASVGVHFDRPLAGASFVDGIVRDNGIGLRLFTTPSYPTTDLLATGNWFQGNDLYGVQNDASSGTIDARSSYWGAASGPTHAGNPGGSGDAVTDDVTYAPFLTAAP